MPERVSQVSSPVGLHRVLDPRGAALPQAARRIDARPEIWPDEVRVRVETLNLDAASYRQLAEAHTGADGRVDGEALRSAVLEIISARGKMQNPVTGSGGMLIGTVEEVGPRTRGLAPGDHIATLVSLSLTPLHITDGLARWDGLSERVPAQGHAILFGRSIAAVLPDDLSPELALMVMDVCGAPALVARVVREYAARGPAPSVLVLGERASPARSRSPPRPMRARACGSRSCRSSARPSCWWGRASPTRSSSRTRAARSASPRPWLRRRSRRHHRRVRRRPRVRAAGHPLDRPGRDHHLLLHGDELRRGGLGAEGVAADVRMLVGNGYVPGHAAYALDLVRRNAAVRRLFEGRLTES